MATAPLPPAYTTRRPTARPALESWRLPAHHQQDLRDLARGVEETNAGMHTRCIGDEEEVHGAIPDEHDPVAMYDAEQFCHRFRVWLAGGWRQRVQRARRAIHALERAGEHGVVGVLQVAYGYADPITRAWPRPVHDAIGDPHLASLLRYTDATEERRAGLVRRELLRGAGAPPPSQGPRELGVLIDIVRVRERGRWLDRVVTSGDALRDALACFGDPRPPKRPGEDKAAYAERCGPWAARRNAHDARRTSFILAARADADALLTAASRRYGEAWRENA